MALTYHYKQYINMQNKKITAVGWLEEEINQQQKMYIDLAKKDKSLKKEIDAILTATTILKMKCEQAKEMENDIEQKWLEYRLYTNNEDAWCFKEWLIEQFKKK